MINKKYILMGLVGLAMSLGFTACNFFPGGISDAKASSRDNGKYGYVDKTGNFVIPPKYDYATDFKDGLATVGNIVNDDYGYDYDQRQYGLVNSKGQFVIPIKNSAIKWGEPSYGEGLIPWNEQNRRDNLLEVRGTMIVMPRMTLEQMLQSQMCGYKNNQGQTVIPAKFDTCLPFNGGLAPAAIKIISKDHEKVHELAKPYSNKSPATKKMITTQIFGVQVFGLIDKTGKWVIQPIFSSIKPAYKLDKIYEIEFNGRKGYLSRNREIVLLPDFDSELYSSTTYDMRNFPQKSIHVGILNNQNKFQLQKSFNWLTELECGLVITKLNNQYYWIELDGTLHPVSELEYSNGLAKVQCRDGSSGFVDHSYKWVIKPRQWSLTPQPWEGQVSIFHDGRAILKRKGIVDEKDALIGLSLDYSNLMASYRKEGMPEAEIEDTIKADKERSKQSHLRELQDKAYIYGAIDNTGRIVIAAKYPQMDEFSEGLAVASEKMDYGYITANMPKYGYLDINGHWAISPEYARARKFREGLAAVKTNNNLWGFIDKSGTFILEPKYAFANDFYDGFAIVITGQQGNYQLAIIDHKGNLLNHPVFDRSGNLVIHPDYAIPEVETYNNKSIDGVGNFTQSPNFGHLIFKDGMARVISMKRHTVLSFNDNLYSLKYNPKIGFLDFQGNLVIPPKFKEAENFQGGFAKVRADNDLWGYIDKAGHFVVPPRCKELGPFNSGLAKCKI